MKRRGFTLIELLIVIAVITLLAGILFPAFARCRRQALATTCVSNMRQIGMGVRMYLQDYDGEFPMGAYPPRPSLTSWYTSWHDELGSYLHTQAILYCPLAPRTLVPQAQGHYLSYGCNPWVSRWMSAAVESAISDPTRMVFATEKQNTDWPADPPSLSGTHFYRPLVPRHDGLLAVLFCDGHVRMLPVPQVESPEAVWRL